MEMGTRHLAFDGHTPGGAALEAATLEWVRTHFVSAAPLMQEAAFSQAFMAFEAAQWVASVGTAKLLLWSALEALVRPGRKDTTHRLSAAVATYLEGDVSARDRLYAKVKALYAARGQMDHAAEEPSEGQVVESFRVARDCFSKAVEFRQSPDADQLMIRWKSRT